MSAAADVLTFRVTFSNNTELYQVLKDQIAAGVILNVRSDHTRQIRPFGFMWQHEFSFSSLDCRKLKPFGFNQLVVIETHGLGVLVIL